MIVMLWHHDIIGKLLLIGAAVCCYWSLVGAAVWRGVHKRVLRACVTRCLISASTAEVLDTVLAAVFGAYLVGVVSIV